MSILINTNSNATPPNGNSNSNNSNANLNGTIMNNGNSKSSKHSLSPTRQLFWPQSQATTSPHNSNVLAAAFAASKSLQQQNQSMATPDFSALFNSVVNPYYAAMAAAAAAAQQQQQQQQQSPPNSTNSSSNSKSNLNVAPLSLSHTQQMVNFINQHSTQTNNQFNSFNNELSSSSSSSSSASSSKSISPNSLTPPNTKSSLSSSSSSSSSSSTSSNKSIKSENNSDEKSSRQVSERGGGGGGSSSGSSSAGGSPLNSSQENVSGLPALGVIGGSGGPVDAKADLDGKDLWDQFCKHGTEMVITKSGR
jgi:hypothetical protein